MPGSTTFIIQQVDSHMPPQCARYSGVIIVHPSYLHMHHTEFSQALRKFSYGELNNSLISIQSCPTTEQIDISDRIEAVVSPDFPYPARPPR